MKELIEECENLRAKLIDGFTVAQKIKQFTEPKEEAILSEVDLTKIKVIKVDSDSITFEGGITLASDHQQDCCENHYLSFGDLTIEDFKDLEFDLTSETFFNRVSEYGIELVPIKGWSVRVPGYGSNNGYYSSDLSLVLSSSIGFNKEFDITECQEYESY